MSLVPYSQVKLPRGLWLLLILVPVALAVAETVKAVKQKTDALLTRPAADSLYVRRDTFALYRVLTGATLEQIAHDVAELRRACVREGKCS